jgi:O-acetyl-ADP-ribose deacetylase (regulator of RNase III)
VTALLVMPLGGAVVTSAGKLNFKVIIHVAVSATIFASADRSHNLI